MIENEGKKIAANKRAARLEAELRANLKKRKDQAKARARVSTPNGEAGTTFDPPTPVKGRE
jgi:hypothetical protein